MNIFNLFKRKKNYKDFVITPEILKKKPVCYGALFKALELDKAIEALCLDGKYHYANIRANSKTIHLLDNATEQNLSKTKNKYSKIYKEHALKTMAAYDRLMFSPKADETIKDNVIRVLLPEHKEYKSAIKG